MKKLSVLVVVVVLVLANVVWANTIDTFGTGNDQFTVEFVDIFGSAGNSADNTGYGAVNYEYRIGKYEVTNGQWDAFVSAAGAPIGNDGGYDWDTYWPGTDVPTNDVSWYEAAQFCNYLTTGDKSLGAYQFSGNNTDPGDFGGIDRESAISIYGMVYVIPTEDEWYKAAYYTGSGYSAYANGTDTAPEAGVDTNYYDSLGQPWDVGDGTQEQNGTFDMMGNVWEWSETFVFSDRVIRGGSFYDSDDDLSSYTSYYTTPTYDYDDMGFRVAAVPEPCSVVLLGLGGLMLRRKKS